MVQIWVAWNNRDAFSHAQEIGSPKSRYQQGRAPARTSENPSLTCPTSGGQRHSLAWGRIIQSLPLFTSLSSLKVSHVSHGSLCWCLDSIILVKASDLSLRPFPHPVRPHFNWFYPQGHDFQIYMSIFTGPGGQDLNIPFEKTQFYLLQALHKINKEAMWHSRGWHALRYKMKQKRNRDVWVIAVLNKEARAGLLRWGHLNQSLEM